RARDAQPRNVVRRPAGDVTAAVQDFPGAWPQAPGQHVVERRFAGAVGPNQRHRLVFKYIEVDVIHGVHAAEVPAQALNGEYRLSHWRANTRSSRVPSNPRRKNMTSTARMMPSTSIQ